MKQYLDLLEDIVENGAKKMDRTGIGTLSVFGRQFRHNLNDGFPLLTTKKLHFKSIIHELLWFLKGSSSIDYLKENKVSIWNEWADKNNNIGPMYGVQWTKWTTKNGKAINQIDSVIDSLKNNPNSRRILFHAWNVEYLPDEKLSIAKNLEQGKMALAPCHLLYQFYVVDGKLLGSLYIRSSDSFLGLPYNIASFSLLVHMLARVCNLKAHEIVITLGDAHAYLNHLEQIGLQLSRAPKKLPKLKVAQKKSIYDYKFEDFELENYQAHPHIKGKVAV